MSSTQSNDLINNNLKEIVPSKTLSTNPNTQSTKEGEEEGVYVDHSKSNILPFIRYFYVPENLCLEELLRANGHHAWLTEVRLRKLYFLISFIQYAHSNSGQSGVKRNGFVRIYSSVLRKNVGKRIINGKAFYRLVIEVLRDIGVLEVNSRYSNAKTQRFPKSFRLGKAYWNQRTKIISFRQKKPGPLKDESRLSNEIQRFVHLNIRQLQIDENALETLLNSGTLDADRSILVRQNAELVRFGAINLRGGAKQRRITHCLTRCPREMRSCFLLKSHPLIEYDIPTCQPILLLALSGGLPNSELREYRDVLHSDIYTALTAHGDRERAKKEFLRFAFGSYKSKNQFGENFQERFPALSKRIREFESASPNRVTLSCYLQDLEAEICIYSVVRQCMGRSIFVVPVHDAFLVEPESFAFINSFVKTEFERRFNFALDLKQKNYDVRARDCSTLKAAA